MLLKKFITNIIYGVNIFPNYSFICLLHAVHLNYLAQVVALEPKVKATWSCRRGSLSVAPVSD